MRLWGKEFGRILAGGGGEICAHGEGGSLDDAVQEDVAGCGRDSRPPPALEPTGLKVT